MDEFTYELTADMPGGLAFNPADRAEAYARYESDPSLSEVPYYPPGHEWIPQWDVRVSVPLVHVMDLLPNVNYPG